MEKQQAITSLKGTVVMLRECLEKEGLDTAAVRNNIHGLVDEVLVSPGEDTCGSAWGKGVKQK